MTGTANVAAPRHVIDPPNLDQVGQLARVAALELAQTRSDLKDRGLSASADALEKSSSFILEANEQDVEAGRRAGLSSTLLDRLTLTEARIGSMAAGLRRIASLPDPVGEIIDGWTRPNGLEIRRARVPIGVVVVIFEARPNVTSDVVGLCLKSGNASILRGSSSAARSNEAISGVMSDALSGVGLPENVFQLVRDLGHEGVRTLMQMRDYVDLLIPRGGTALISDIINHATVPYVIDGDGNCHIYVDEAADLGKAPAIVFNSKVSRPSVCNSAEKLLVHEAVADRFLPDICRKLVNAGVELRGDPRAQAIFGPMTPVMDDDWKTEYLDLTMAVSVVDGVDEAIDHIRRYTSGHTEAIVTENIATARRFVATCPAAVVMINASTRFTDGGEFGFGAEIGNSTQRLHARGPLGLRELTTYRYEVWGDGQVRT